MKRKFTLIGAFLSSLTTLAAAAPQVICSLDQPVISSQQSVKASAFSSASNLEFHWAANAGAFAGQPAEHSREATGQTVEWRSDNTQPGSYTLTVSNGAQGSPAACSLTVIVSAAEQRAITSTASSAQNYRGALLVSGHKELEGYGLYSYMLLGATPSAAERERFHTFIQVYLDKILKIKAVEGEIDSSKLNVTFMPVDSEPGQEVKPEKLPDWILDHYDFRRAQAILRRVPGNHGDGPYIFSSFHPVDFSASSVTKPYLLDDLSHAPPSVVGFFVDQFLAQTSQARFDQVSKIDEVAVTLREAIAYAAKAIPNASNAAAAWIVIGK
ncbi:MAG: hypothetical protein JO097_20690 [Acidobacteriaceae bacterium]|nr:hypothetical protein [Acidobacteriaceae bacterium]